MPTVHALAAEELAQWLRERRGDVLVVDVRDDDREGGHITGSLHAPSHRFLVDLPLLLAKAESAKHVVFHCMLSHVRGPSCAMKYARAAEEIKDRVNVELGKAGNATADNEHATTPPGPQQMVHVLTGGFSRWQEVHGIGTVDPLLLEAYDRERWAEGFMD